MKTLVWVVMLLLVVLAMGACTVKLGNTGSSDNTPAPAAVQPPATPEKPASPYLVKILQVGDKYDRTTKELTHKTTTFRPSAEMHIVAGITGLTKGEVVSCALKAVDVTKKDGTRLRDYDVTSVNVTAPGAVSTLHFSFTGPPGGWPVGEYSATIKAKDTVLETVAFKVK